MPRFIVYVYILLDILDILDILDMSIYYFNHISIEDISGTSIFKVLTVDTGGHFKSIGKYFQSLTPPKKEAGEGVCFFFAI